MSFQRCPATAELPERWLFEQGGARAMMVPSAGMNLVSLEIQGTPFLHLPSPLQSFMGRPKTGGVPLLHPWANRLRGDTYALRGTTVDLATSEGLKRDEHGLPMHGLVLRRPDFEVVPDGESSVVGVLDWNPTTVGFDAFPFAHRLEVRWSVRLEKAGVRATCTTRVLAGPDPVPLGTGWHPYLAPGGVDGTGALEVRSPRLQRVALDGLGLPIRDDGALSIVEEVDFDGPLGETPYDDLYLTPRDGWEVVVRRDGHRIRLVTDGQWPVVQIYAPVDAGYACVEPMLAPTAALSDGQARVVESGTSLSAGFSLVAERADA